jgi:hypothetical protein
MNQEGAWQQFAALPPDQQREVLDFMAFLQERRVLPTTRKISKPTKLSAEPFLGCWSDRQDLQDSVAWVHKTRQHEWKDCRG